VNGTKQSEFGEAGTLLPAGNSRRARLGLGLTTGVLLLAFLGSLPGQTNVSKPATTPGGNRFLLIVETSKSMQRRADGVQATIQDLFTSSMNGQLRPGDTLGVWTYNEDLFAGRFPLQQWSTAKQKDVIQSVISFLQAQKYEKQPRLAKVMPTLERVVANSDRITVILVSDGIQPMQGTPFDNPINEYFQKWRTQQQENHMPFLTLLRGQAGAITSYSVAAAPWRLEFPPLPEPTKVVKTSAPATNTSPPKPASTLPPLIVSGKKPQPSAPTKSTEPALLQPPLSTSLAGSVSNAIASSTAAPVAWPVPHNPSPLPTNTASSPQSASAALVTRTIDPAPAVAAQADPPAAPALKPPTPDAHPSRDPVPDTSAAESKPPADLQSQAPANSDPGKSQAKETSVPPPAAPLAQVAVTAPVARRFGTNSLWFAGGGCGLAFGAMLFWRARPRRDQQTSFITRSIEK
jgi:hypothetical protein